MNKLDSIKYKGYKINIYQDINADNPFNFDEGFGNFYHWKDYGKEDYLKYCEALGYNPDTREKIAEDNPLAVRIDKYEHRQVYYSVEGEGYQCKWDTSGCWAVWLPNECLMEDIKRLKTKKAQRKRCIELAREACVVFNQWANGEVYGYMIEDKEGIESGGCWEFYGYEHDKSGLIEHAKEEIDNEIECKINKHIKKIKEQIKNRCPLDKRNVLEV